MCKNYSFYFYYFQLTWIIALKLSVECFEQHPIGKKISLKPSTNRLTQVRIEMAAIKAQNPLGLLWFGVDLSDNKSYKKLDTSRCCLFVVDFRCVVCECVVRRVVNKSATNRSQRMSSDMKRQRVALLSRRCVAWRVLYAAASLYKH